MSYLGLALYAEGPTDYYFFKPLLRRLCEELCAQRGHGPVDIGDILALDDPFYNLKEASGMTKADIVDRIAEKTGFSKKDSVELVELVFDTLKSTLESGENLKISGFGNFVVKQKSDRRGRNPQTGEEITIEARKILTFKPSNMLKESINS